MFYDTFSDLCKRKGVSVTKATVEIGLSRTIGSAWKQRGLTPKGDTLQKIADYFGVTTDYLLGAEADEKEKAPTPKDERKPNSDDIKIALFGGDTEVTDEMWDEALFAVDMIKERYKRKKAKG